MYEREVDGRREVAITDIEALVPENHLVRKIEKVMDYEWIYERVAPYYSAAKNVRPGTDPVVLIKMVLLQHLFGIPSLRQTYQRACDTISYRWFLGYGLLDKLPHFATVSYAFCRRFPEELATEIFEHILNKALNNHMVDSSMIFIDGTHIKASANKKKYQKEQVAKAARVYAKRLREEVNEERAKLGKPPVEEEEDRPRKTSPKITPIKQVRKSGGAGMEVCVIKPTSIEDGREITETLLANRTVVLNLEGLDVDIAQRIIDFTSGSCFAISGNLQKISQYIFIITPASVDISGDFQDIFNGSVDVPGIR